MNAASRTVGACAVVLAALLFACGTGQGQGTVESAALLIGAAFPPDRGPIVVEGRLLRISDAVPVPVRDAEVEVVQDGRVLAMSKVDLEGRFVLKAVVTNGSISVRMSGSDTSTRLHVEWTKSPFRNVDVVLRSPSPSPSQ